jgi:cephalosporin hydroxylase
MNWMDIEGWFSPNDAKSYNQLANKLHNDILVEIGSHKGRSIASIIPTCKKNKIQVIAVDTWGYNLYDYVTRILVDHIYKLGFSVPTKRNFLETIRQVDPDFDVFAISDPSSFVAKAMFSVYRYGKVGGVFIDAQHDYHSVKEDISAWLPLIKSGGWIAGHDFSGEWTGVKKAVEEIFGSDYKTMKDQIWVHYL